MVNKYTPLPSEVIDAFNEVGNPNVLTLNDIPTIPFLDLSKNPEAIGEVKPPWSTDTEYTFECSVDPRMVSKLMGDIPTEKTKFSAEFTGTQMDQKRKHKKKRINKKWAKRYGMREAIRNMRLTDVTIVPGNSPEDFELMFNSCKTLKTY